MPALNHLHTYERMRKPKNEYYRCIHPDCTHYIHRNLIPGKRTVCSCGEEFILTYEDLNLKLPHCVYCGKNARPRPVDLDPLGQDDVSDAEEPMLDDWRGEL